MFFNTEVDFLHISGCQTMFGLRFVPGAIPGIAKRKAPRTDSSVNNKNKTEVKQNFVEKKKVCHPWLTYDSDKHKMFCNICTIHKTSLYFLAQSGIRVLVKRITKPSATILPIMRF